MMQFTQWLKERRKLLDLTQADVAEKVGCSLVTIYKIEAGERRPSKQIADRLADCLGIAAEQREGFIRLARSIDPKSPPVGGSPAAPPSRHLPPVPAQKSPPPSSEESAPARTMRLPIPPTRLVGRQSELEQIVAHTVGKSRRLITLIGPAGVGKTRLALEVANICADSFAQGAYWISLADIRDPDLVAPAIAQALAIKEQPGLQERLPALLRGRDLLLVLDNFEHLAAAAPLVGALLGACPELVVLATSRVPLRIGGEQQVPLQPLRTPPEREQADPARLASNQAVALFVERARSINPRFALDATNAPAVAALCQRLDGLPLAIELVAVHTKLMSPQALLGRIRDNALPVLKGGPVDLPSRHQTLREAFEWSYGLLPAPIGRVFAALGVFNAGWTAEAVGAICPDLDETAIEAAILHLIDASLVQASWSDGALAPHFSLLETVRDYALERLAAADAVAATRARHAVHYCVQAEAAAAQLTGPGQAAAIADLQRNLPNLRAALEWSLESAPALAERLGAAVWRFWWLRGYFTEGLGWLKRILDLPATERARRAMLFNGAGAISLELGDFSAARSFHQEALAVRRDLGDLTGIAGSLGNLGNVARQQEDFLAARDFYSESLGYFRRLGHAWGVATTLLNLGTAVEGLRDYAAAREYYAQSRDCYEELGDNHGLALALSNLGGIALLEEDSGLALRMCRQSLPRFQAIASYSGIAIDLDAVARALAMQGRPAEAAQLMGAAAALRRRFDLPIKPTYVPHYELTMRMVRERCGPEFDDHWARGETLDAEAAIALALGGD